MIGNDGGGGKEIVWGSGGRSFERRGAVMDMAWLPLAWNMDSKCLTPRVSRLRQRNGFEGSKDGGKTIINYVFHEMPPSNDNASIISMVSSSSVAQIYA